jgi:hypothetical protein
MEAIVVHDFYFVHKRDAIGLLSLSSIQKCIFAIKMLAYGVAVGVAVDYTDEYCRLKDSTALECLKRFVKAI